jgi:hypothetical protein
MNSRFPELGMPLKKRLRAALDETKTHREQSGHVLRAERPRSQRNSAARWAERALNHGSKEFPEVPTEIFRCRHKRILRRFRSEVGTIPILKSSTVNLRRGEDALQRP